MARHLLVLAVLWHGDLCEVKSIIYQATTRTLQEYYARSLPWKNSEFQGGAIMFWDMKMEKGWQQASLHTVAVSEVTRVEALSCSHGSAECRCQGGRRELPPLRAGVALCFLCTRNHNGQIRHCEVGAPDSSQSISVITPASSHSPSVALNKSCLFSLWFRRLVIWAGPSWT